MSKNPKPNYYLKVEKKIKVNQVIHVGPCTLCGWSSKPRINFLVLSRKLILGLDDQGRRRLIIMMSDPVIEINDLEAC